MSSQSGPQCFHDSPMGAVAASSSSHLSRISTDRHCRDCRLCKPHRSRKDHGGKTPERPNTQEVLTWNLCKHSPISVVRCGVASLNSVALSQATPRLLRNASCALRPWPPGIRESLRRLDHGCSHRSCRGFCNMPRKEEANCGTCGACPQLLS